MMILLGNKEKERERVRELKWEKEEKEIDSMAYL